jgi:curved DNA-binding protein CbpA
MMPHGEQNYYQRLGVTPSATPAQLKEAYRARILETHPDLHPGLDPARCQLVRTAYAVLANPDQRRHYDAAMGYGRDAQRPCIYRRSFDRLFASLCFGLRATTLSLRELSDEVDHACRKAG